MVFLEIDPHTPLMGHEGMIEGLLTRGLFFRSGILLAKHLLDEIVSIPFIRINTQLKGMGNVNPIG